MFTGKELARLKEEFARIAKSVLTWLARPSVWKRSGNAAGATMVDRPPPISAVGQEPTVTVVCFPVGC